MEEFVLIVEDEKNIVELVKFNLEREGFNVLSVGDGAEALKLVQEKIPTLIILDLMLPIINGMDVCRIIRQDQKLRKIPIIMLTAKGKEKDRIDGFEVGADDYIVKPFSPKELVMRVKAILRRTNKETGPELTRKDKFALDRLNIDFENYRITLDGEKVDLTLKEFEVLKLLLSNPGRVFTRSFLLDQIWGYEYYGDSRTVDVHIRRLRQKVEEPLGKELIETVRGVGYRYIGA